MPSLSPEQLPGPVIKALVPPVCHELCSERGKEGPCGAVQAPGHFLMAI